MLHFLPKDGHQWFFSSRQVCAPYQASEPSCFVHESRLSSYDWKPTVVVHPGSQYEPEVWQDCCDSLRLVEAISSAHPWPHECRWAIVTGWGDWRGNSFRREGWAQLPVGLSHTCISISSCLPSCTNMARRLLRGASTLILHFPASRW